MKHLTDAEIDTLVCGTCHIETWEAFQARKLRITRDGSCSYNKSLFPFDHFVTRLGEALDRLKINSDIPRLFNSLARNKDALKVDSVRKVVVYDSMTDEVRYVFENEDAPEGLNDIVGIDLNFFRKHNKVSSATKNIVTVCVAGFMTGLAAHKTNSAMAGAIIGASSGLFAYAFLHGLTWTRGF